MLIKENLEKIKSELPENVKVVAISKTKPAEMILKAYEAGHKIFGENRAQELSEKHEHLPKDIQWHMVGHLQRNKVKYIAPFVNLIHSIDSPRLLKAVNKEARKNERIIAGLLQFHIAEEESKYGFSLESAEEMLQSDWFRQMDHIQLLGVMGMATFTEDMEKVRSEFRQLKSIFDHLKKNYFANSDDFREISMGMSNDYQVAIEEGSSMVRIGSLIFGERE